MLREKGGTIQAEVIVSAIKRGDDICLTDEIIEGDFALVDASEEGPNCASICCVA